MRGGDRPLKVLLVHNYYQQPGGEDEVFRAEGDLLEAHGYEVIRYTRHNDELAGMNSLQQLASAFWNRQSCQDLEQIVRNERPDIAHFHNTMPLISPSALRVAWNAGAATVLTLHNYRMICPNALLLREGRICQDCVGKHFAWPGIRHQCYRNSWRASAAVAALTAGHRTFGTWDDYVDRYVALTEFAKAVFVSGGLPAERIAVKPNFVPTPPEGSVAPPNDPFALFVGRLSEEKGIRVLLDAWSVLKADIRLVIAGDGPLGSELEARRKLPL